jgi:hypothetical protein
MSFTSGPGLPADEQGRAVAHGYVITGDDTSGYRARLLVGLTAQEAQWGCVEVLFADSLADLLAQAQAQKIVRSMVGLSQTAAAAVPGGGPAAVQER